MHTSYYYYYFKKIYINNNAFCLYHKYIKYNNIKYHIRATKRK